MPHYKETCGGIGRMKEIARRIMLELPHYSVTCGGVTDTIKLANLLPDEVCMRFQNGSQEYPQIGVSWSVGMPDNTFPECDVVITYSDNPYVNKLLELPQVKKVIVLMLSYGMAIERERANVLNEKITAICSTKKIEEAIKKDGGKVIRVGFGIDMDDMYDIGKKRKNYLALLYHNMWCKNYSFGVEVADKLYADGVIDGVITFGREEGYETYKHPKGLIKHYPRATREQVREILNTCKCYFSPAVSEGLNLIPIEAALCGCPPVLSDGAIDEIFFNGENCIIIPKNDFGEAYKNIKMIIESNEVYADGFKKDMQYTIKDFTWDDTIKKIMDVL